MTISNYDKIAAHLMETSAPTITLKFDDVQGLLREYRELHLAVESMGMDPKTAVERYKARRANGEAYSEAKSAVLLENQVQQLKDALKATLLFHSGQPWDKEKSSEWFKLTGSHEATTKVMCDNSRAVLARIITGPEKRAPSELALLRAALAEIIRCFGGGPSTAEDHGAWLTECEDALDKARPLLPHVERVEPDTSESPTGRLNVDTKPAMQNNHPGWTIQDTIREVLRVQDRREEVRRKLDAGEITREEARREFPESY